MKRRKFLHSSLAVTAAAAAGHGQPIQKEIYEWREYEMRFGSDPKQLEDYFKTALIPALNKHGVKTVGVFKQWPSLEPARFYLLLPYASFENYYAVNTKLKTDADYLKNSAAYHSIPAEKPLFNRYSSSLMLAFDGWPKLIIPPGGTRVFELRTYEGYSEDAVRRKIKMFHDGEFPIFQRANLNPVFCGEVIAGDRQPRLTYLISCNSMEERDKGWSSFVADPEWKKLVSNPEYAHTISTIRNSFLVRTPYSQV